MERLIRASPFDELYGLALQEASAECSRALVPITPALSQPLGLVHGGVYAAIAESLASLGTNAAVVASGRVALGQHNATSFLRPASAGELHCSAHRRHLGRTSALWDVEITDDDGRTCALSRVTLALRQR